MLAHLSVPALDKKYPSSLSYKTVNNLLRGDYEFNGITITDALDMKGVLQDPSINVDLRAFEVGNDIILMSTNVSEGVKLISESYKKGKISESRLSSSVKKILSLKARSNLKNFKNISTENILSKVNTSKDTLLYSNAMSSAITLVKNTKNILPLANDKKYLHVAFGKHNSGAHFYDKMNKYLNLDSYTNEDMTSLFSKTKYDGIVISYHGSSKSPYASNIIPKEIVEKINKISINNNVVLNLFLNPYSLNSFESIDNFESIIIGYQNNMISQEVLADLLYGVRSFKGKIPVSNNFFKVNHGLTFNKKNIIGYSRPSYEGFDITKLSYLDSLAKNAIDSMMTPGIQMLVSRKGKIVYNKSFGYHTYEKVNKLENNHIFDLSSITKILATMPLVLQEFDKNNISLETNYQNFFQKKNLTIRGYFFKRNVISLCQIETMDSIL